MAERLSPAARRVKTRLTAPRPARSVDRTTAGARRPRGSCRRASSSPTTRFDFEAPPSHPAPPPYRCAEAGEVPRDRGRIADGDLDSWFDALDRDRRPRPRDRRRSRAGTRPAPATPGCGRRNTPPPAFFHVLGTRDPARSLPTWQAHRAAFDTAIGALADPGREGRDPLRGHHAEGLLARPGGDARPPARHPHQRQRRRGRPNGRFGAAAALSGAGTR